LESSFFTLAVSMGLALVPGFPRTTVIDRIALTPDALPYSLGLGFPKVVAGIFIIGFITARACVRGASSALCSHARPLCSS